MLRDLEPSAVLYSHFLDIAKAAAEMLRQDSKDKQNSTELELLGRRALREAAKAFEGTDTEFEDLVQSDEKIARILQLD